MPIPSSNFGAVLFLCELRLQIHLFERSMTRLTRAAQHWRDLHASVDDGQTASPLEIVAECSVCLSSLAAVRRVLYPGVGATSTARRRSEALLAVLGNPTLVAVQSVAVRNSWEHLDERLDAYLRQESVGVRAVSEVHVSVDAPTPGTLALRRFDPVDLAIHYAEDRVALGICAEEIAELSCRIKEAYRRLQSEQVDV